MSLLTKKCQGSSSFSFNTRILWFLRFIYPLFRSIVRNTKVFSWTLLIQRVTGSKTMYICFSTWKCIIIFYLIQWFENILSWFALFIRFPRKRIIIFWFEKMSELGVTLVLFKFIYSCNSYLSLFFYSSHTLYTYKSMFIALKFFLTMLYYWSLVV